MTSTEKSSTLSASNAAQKVIRKIQSEGYTSNPRGQAVKELYLETLEIDPKRPLMEFSARPFNWKYFMGEMAWYLIKDDNVDFINNFSNFWKNIANEYGTINSNYGKILFGEQLQWALDSLKKDKNTRQAIAFVNQPKYQYEDNKDFVCTMYINFWIRDNKLNMKVQMRSNDIFYGLTYDAPFFAFLQQSMLLWLEDTYTDLELGKYYHCADNIHYYQRHFEIAEEIVNENITHHTSLQLKAPMFYLKTGNMLATSDGLSFITDVVNLLNAPDEITQDNAKEVMNKYFIID